MAEESEFWKSYSGYVKFGSVALGIAAGGLGSWQHFRETRDADATPAVYDLRVKESVKDIDSLQAQSNSITARIQVNAEDIARLKADVSNLEALAIERKERFLAVESETRRLADEQRLIWDKIRSIEQGRKR